MPDKPTYEQLEQRVKDLEQNEIKHQRIEKELKISKKLLRDVMDMAPVFICAKNMDGKFILANKKLADFYQTTVDEILKGAHADICEDKDELRSMIADDHEVINSGKPKLISEETMKSPDGQVVILETCKIPFTAYDDPAVLIVATDITARKRDEEERKKLEDQIRHSQKLESLGRLAGGVAHDLNNLLSPILGYSELLFYNAKENDKHKEFIEQIIQASRRAKDIVRQLLTFSRKQPLEFKDIDINKILARFEKLLVRTLREDITVNIKPAPHVPMILGDIGQLEQVIMNLSVNAQDAMAEGGTLIFETSFKEVGRNTSCFDEKVIPGKYVVLSVSDNGCGMDDETRRNLFDPFFSTKGNRGTGLGLSMVYGIIKQHGGYVFVNSKPGKGSTFNIYLPASREIEMKLENDAAIAPNLYGNETILIVEDNPQVRKVAHDILMLHGYTVLEAENGERAMEILNEYEEPVHLVLTDVIMPKMDGKKLADQIADSDPEVKILYMSGYTDDMIAHHGVLNGDLNFIQKPFSLQALSIKIREVLDSCETATGQSLPPAMP